MAPLNNPTIALKAGTSPVAFIILIAAIVLLIVLTAVYAAHRDTRAAYAHMDAAAESIHADARHPYIQAQAAQRYRQNLEEFEMQEFSRPSGFEMEGQNRRPFSSFFQKRRLHDLEEGRPQSAGADIDEMRRISTGAVGRFVAIMRGQYPTPASKVVEEVKEEVEAKPELSQVSALRSVAITQGKNPVPASEKAVEDEPEVVQVNTPRPAWDKPLPATPGPVPSPANKKTVEDDPEAVQVNTPPPAWNKPRPDTPVPVLCPVRTNDTEDSSFSRELSALFQRWTAIAKHVPQLTSPSEPVDGQEPQDAVRTVSRRRSMTSYTDPKAKPAPGRRRRQSLPGVHPLRRMQGKSVAEASVRNKPVQVISAPERSDLSDSRTPLP